MLKIERYIQVAGTQEQKQVLREVQARVLGLQSLDVSLLFTE